MKLRNIVLNLGYLKLSTCFISIYLLIYFLVVFDRVFLILWLHNLLVNTNWMKSGIGNIVLNDLKQRKKLCSVVSQSIFLQYFQNDHCIKQKMVTTMYIFKICVNSEWHFQDYGIVKYHWLCWLSKNNICEICSCAHPLNSPVGMHVFSHL